MIWSSLLPHSAGVNAHPELPRVAQYFTCVPNREDWEPRSPESVNLCDVGTKFERKRMARERLAKFYLDFGEGGLPSQSSNILSTELPRVLQADDDAWKLVTGEKRV